ncbi:MAG: patatin-like phospholipase family protein [Bacteroidota bacterium]
MRTFLLLGAIIFSIPVFCQQSSIKNLVFEGAGIRGIAYTGAVEALQEAGALDQVEKYGGTSAGAVIAMTLALGYDAEEIRDILQETEFQKFNDGNFLGIGGVRRMKNRYGWYKGDKVIRWLEDIIEAKSGNPDLNFSQLYALKGKDLYTVGTNLSKQEMIVFSRETFPEMKLKDAVRISMSIPLYFEAIFIDEQGTIYDKPDAKPGLQIIVDGGIIGNYPIQIFDSTFVEDGQVIRVPNQETLGIKIDDDEQIEYDEQQQGLSPREIDSFRSYIEAFYVFALENLNRSEMQPEDWERTILVSCKDIGPKIKRLSSQEVNTLVSSGRSSVKAYFEAS